MKKKILLLMTLLMGFMVIVPTKHIFAQEYEFKPVATVIKNYTGASGGLSPFITGGDVKSSSSRPGFYGYFDSVDYLNSSGAFLARKADSNFFRFNGTTGDRQVKIKFTHVQSRILHHDVINGASYISVLYHDSTSIPGAYSASFLRINPQTLEAEALPIKFDATVGVFTQLNDSLVFLGGGFYRAMDASGVPEIYGGKAILNIRTKRLMQMPGTGISGSYLNISKGTDGTVLILFNARLVLKAPGSLGWQDDLLPPLPTTPANQQFKRGCVVDVNHVYVSILEANVGVQYLAKPKNGQWEKSLKFSRTPGGPIPVAAANLVSSITHRDGKLYITGPFNQVNDVASTGIIMVDTATMQVTNLPSPTNTLDVGGTNLLLNLGGEVFFIDTETILFGYQIIYRLNKKVTAPIITDVAVNGSRVTYTTTSIYPNSTVRLMLNSQTATPFASGLTNSSGTFVYSEDRVNGSYTAYAKVELSPTEVSPVSTGKSFTVNVVLTAPTITWPIESVFTNSFSVKGNHPKNGALIKIYREAGSTDELLGTGVANNGDYEISVTLPNGQHQIYAIEYDTPIGNVSPASNLRNLLVGQLTGITITPSGLPKDFKLYPNPVRLSTSFTMTGLAPGTKSIVSMMDVLGRSLEFTTRTFMVNGINSAEVRVSPLISRGTYFVRFIDSNKDIRTAQFIIQ